jgi:hypothetical protein
LAAAEETVAAEVEAATLAEVLAAGPMVAVRVVIGKA